MAVATITIINELSCRVSGLSTSDMLDLNSQYAMHTANYFHQVSYKLGTWDGKKKLVYKDGTTFVYLLKTIIPKLKSKGYDIEYVDHRRALEVPTDMQIDENLFAEFMNDTGDPFIMRDYQVGSLNTVIKKGGGIIGAGTGAGKTIMSAALTKVYSDKNLRCVVIVPNLSLVKQSHDYFVLWGIDCGRLDGKTKDINHPHLLTTWQSLANMAHILTEYDVIIVDECQTAKAGILFKLITEYAYNAIVRIGMTGSMPPHPLDNLLVRVALGSVVYDIPVHELQKAEHLSTININMYELDEQIDEGYFPDYTSEMSYVRTHDPRNSWVVDFAVRTTQQPLGNTLLLVSNKTAGRKLLKNIKKKYPDMEVYYLNGDDDVEARAEIYNLFKVQSNILVIATVQIAGVGLSIDRIFNLILLDVGKSFIRVVQAIGRGLRRNKKSDKTHCEIYDVYSNLKYGLIHKKERIKTYKKLKYPHSVESIHYVWDHGDTLEITT